MAYTDQVLTCSDCGIDFVFSASEQEFFAQKGFTSAPKRCPSCRAQRRASGGGSSYGNGGGYASGGGFSRGPREMFDAVCARCGKDCERFEGDPQMQKCAEVCLECADSCGKMSR